jgi:hypothetical protein
MGSKAPPIPPDQRSRPNDKPHIDGRHGGRVSGGPSSRDQGRFGNTAQNTHHTQDR